MNTEVIAVDQDKAGVQGSVVAQSPNCNMLRGSAHAIDSWTGRVARQRRKRHEAENPSLKSAGTCTALPDCQQTWLRSSCRSAALALP